MLVSFGAGIGDGGSGNGKGGTDRMGLKCFNRKDPKNVDFILSEIRAKVPFPEKVKIRQLKDLLFDSVQMTSGEWAYFLRIHRDVIFKCEDYREDSQFRNSYQAKTQIAQGGDVRG